MTTRTTSTAATGNTLGTKGVGEAGTIASTPCIVNGVVDALRIFGVDDVQMPCTPERVWRAIEGSKAGGATDTPPDAMPHFVEGEANQQSHEGALNQDGAGQ